MAINRVDGQGLRERPEGLGKSGSTQSDDGRTARLESVAREGDRVELSREARRIAELRKAVAELPDVRESRVAELREALRRGTYQVDSRELARAILKDTDAIDG